MPPARRSRVRGALGACDAPQGTLGAARPGARIPDAWTDRRGRAIPGRRRRYLVRAELLHAHAPMVVLGAVLFESRPRERNASAISIAAISVWLGAGASPGGQGLAGIGARVRRTRAAVHAHRMAGRRP